ncbi:MAG TPA: hypothetical protein VI297_08935 [Gemmatimonadales bacterium]
MRPLPASVALVIAGAGPPAAILAQQPELVQLAQQVPVSSLDSTLPPIAFEPWLARLLGGSRSAIRWEVNDCGEGGDGLAAPTCVEAILGLAPDTAAHASLIVAGTDGMPGKPAVWLLYATGGNSMTPYKALSEWAAWVRGHRGSRIRKLRAPPPAPEPQGR